MSLIVKTMMLMVYLDESLLPMVKVAKRFAVKHIDLTNPYSCKQFQKFQVFVIYDEAMTKK